VVVYFYPQDDTPGCTKEACQFNDELSGFEGAGVDVLGVSADDADSHRRFRAKYGLRFRLLTDAGHAVAAQYGAYGEKVLYGKPAVGVIRSTFLVDPEGRIERVWYGVRTDGHAARVLAEVGASA
jgi:thioredoxin-dependent peroxiredoxin